MLSLFAQQAKDPDAAGALAGLAGCFGTTAVLMLIVIVLAFAILWKVFSKAGQPGWAALVPIYNTWILVTAICKKEPVWFILSFIPVVNIFVTWVVCRELARNFGKSDLFGMGLFFLGPIFLAVLAFGDAKYKRGRSLDDDDDFDDRPRRRSRDEADED
ncbi:MAG TPA: DUF5684 domain-containing protein [Urbifossiella sp.]